MNKHIINILILFFFQNIQASEIIVEVLSGWKDMSTQKGSSQ